MRPSTVEERVFPVVTPSGWVGKAKVKVYRCKACLLVVKSEETA